MGFTTVKNLSGHTIKPYIVHAGVSIPSYNNKDTRCKASFGSPTDPIEVQVYTGQGLMERHFNIKTRGFDSEELLVEAIDSVLDDKPARIKPQQSNIVD